MFLCKVCDFLNEIEKNNIAYGLRQISLSSGLGLFLATLFFLGIQATLVSKFSFLVTLTAILTGQTGLLVGLRLLLLAAVGGILYRVDLQKALPARILAGLTLGLLFTFSLQSHSAALQDGRYLMALLSDWLHFVTITAWLGGLPALVWVLRQHG